MVYYQLMELCPVCNKAVFMDYFLIYSYLIKDETGIHFGDSTIKFEDDKIILGNGYEYDDKDGERIYEGQDYYYIFSKDIKKILSLIPDEHKNESILAEYKNADNYYLTLSSDDAKLFFISVLKCYKIGKAFDALLKILTDNGIYYRHKEMRY